MKKNFIKVTKAKDLPKLRFLDENKNIDFSKRHLIDLACPQGIFIALYPIYPYPISYWTPTSSSTLWRPDKWTGFISVGEVHILQNLDTPTVGHGQSGNRTPTDST
jgi:hypothetical protein